MTTGDGVDVALGESKVDHVDRSLIRWIAKCTISKLNVAMEDFPVMHCPES